MLTEFEEAALELYRNCQNRAAAPISRRQAGTVASTALAECCPEAYHG